ncbi:hypothetical protein [Myxococcus sp. AB022]|uniref:hypothetical protein n=1 Tax=Myxococcus sp. AB022 TaxID=2562797 RepID=UPI00114276A5|nr:hypothetical protein [Myxococcus sp. AB022]
MLPPVGECAACDTVTVRSPGVPSLLDRDIRIDRRTEQREEELSTLPGTPAFADLAQHAPPPPSAPRSRVPSRLSRPVPHCHTPRSRVPLRLGPPRLSRPRPAPRSQVPPRLSRPEPLSRVSPRLAPRSPVPPRLVPLSPEPRPSRPRPAPRSPVPPRFSRPVPHCPTPRSQVPPRLSRPLLGPRSLALHLRMREPHCLTPRSRVPHSARLSQVPPRLAPLSPSPRRVLP